MVGNRLVKFLSTILPTHCDYYTQDDVTAIEARERSQGQVSIVAKYLDQIAILIDKQEHEDYISSVLWQHQEEKSNKIASLSDQQREHMYYSDDTDDDPNDVNKYLETIPSVGSDSTARLNNTSTSSACNTVDSSDQNRQLPPKSNYGSKQSNSLFAHGSTSRRSTYRDEQHDISVVSDSVDLLLESPDVSSGKNFLSEDPSSTPSHTILRVSPTNEAKPDRHAPRSLSDQMKPQQLPIVRSHWVANQPTKQSTIDKALNSSVDRILDSAERANEVGSPSSRHLSPERSIGGSVQSIIRSWPPKQDPPGVNIESVQQSRGLEPLENSVNLRFKPMSDLQRRAAELDKGSPSRESVELEPIVVRHKWSDVGRVVSRREPSLGSSRVRFSSSSCSSSSRERSTTDDESENAPGESHYSYADMNSPEKDSSAVALSSPLQSAPKSSLTISTLTKPVEEYHLNRMEQGTSKPDGMNALIEDSDFPSTLSSKAILLVDPLVIIKSRDVDQDISPIRIKSPTSIHEGHFTGSLDRRDISFHNQSPTQANRSTIAPVPKADEAEATSFANFGRRDSSFSEMSPSLTNRNVISPGSKASESDTPIFANLGRRDVLFNDLSPSQASRNAFESETPTFANLARRDMSFSELSPSQANQNVTAPASIASESETPAFANFEFPEDFRTQQASQKVPGPSGSETERNGIIRSSPLHQSGVEESQRRGSGPVDLDLSTTSSDALSEIEGHDGISTNNRGFLADGIDYVLPLPRTSNGKSSPVVTSYAPSAADWSIDEPLMDSHRFERQRSTISIDSTEFGVTPASHNIGFLDNCPAEAPAWANDWSHFDSLPNPAHDASHASPLDTSDTSYKMTMSDSMFSKTTDTRGIVTSKGMHGPTYADRTSSTGSSSSTPSKEPSQGCGPLSKTSQLLDPFSSRTPIEAPFLLDEEETPYMIDSKAEQRLRVSMKSPTDLVSRSPNVPGLSPNQIGLYGSLKGFQSLDCTLPFDDAMTENQERSLPRNGNPLLCRSRQKHWSDQRSPNEDDWEDSSLLMARNHNGHKSCVRCLLT